VYAAKASYLVEAAWGQTLGGLFRFGLSTIGGTDTMGAASWSAQFNEPNSNLTLQTDGSHVSGFATTRGRADDLTSMQAGVAEVVIRDPDARYNRENESSPLYGALDAMRPLRISGTFGGVKYPMYYGFTDRIDWQPVAGRGGVATISCVDFFAWLQQRKPTLADSGVATTGNAIKRLLDDVDWTDPAMRDIATGDTIPGFSADGTVDSLALIEALLVAERGAFFIAASGAATYKDRHYPLRGGVDATIVDVMTGLSTGVDRANVRNQWTVTRTGGVPQIVSDAASQKKYGHFDDSLESIYFMNDAAALGLANWLVLIQKDAVTRVWETSLRNTTSAMLTQQLARELYDNVHLSAAHGSTEGDYTIQQITHRVSLGGGLHETTWRCSAKGVVNAFTFGTSVFGGSDVLVN
jgi:hypothetical protein